jgi:hypothetical protein
LGAGILEITEEIHAGLARDKEREHGSALRAAGVFLEVKKRIEKRIPTAPRNEFGLTVRGVVEGGGQRGRLRITEGAGGGENECGRAGLFTFKQLAALAGNRGCVDAGGLEKRGCDRLEVDRHHPRRSQHEQAGYHPDRGRSGTGVVRGTHSLCSIHLPLAHGKYTLRGLTID